MAGKLRIGIFLLSIIVLFSCKKKVDDSVLGLDVQPENDLVGITITDTSSVYMHTQKVDSSRTYMDQYKYLGSTLDPIFGRTDASIYTSISIKNNLTNVSFGNNPVLDKAELVIKITKDQFIGDSTTDLNYQVYLMNGKLNAASLYYNAQTVPHSISPVSIGSGHFEYRNSIYYLIIPIESNYGQSILQNTSNLVNNTAFQNANNGFYITSKNSPLAGPGSGAIFRYELDDDLCGLNLYYHDGNSVSAKGEIFQFTFKGADATRINNIKQNYSTANMSLYDQITGDTTKGGNNIFLGSFGGTRARVYLPNLANFNDSQNVAISRAELIVKIDQITAPASTNYGFPADLALIAAKSDGVEELVWDQVESSDLNKYSGIYDATNKQYVFNIARQMQKIVNDNITNYGFYLVNASPSPIFVARRDNRLQRVVLGGKNNATYKAFFKVTYIKFPHDK